MENPVLFSSENGIAVITLNRPERRNALNQALLSGLYRSIDELASRDDLFVGIITGNGASFSAGVDLSCLATDNLFDPLGDGRDMVDVFRACKKPIIGAVNGHSITGGFELALNCDFLIASEKASFADTHAKVGIHPGWGMTQLLQKTIGQRMAKQLSLTCETVTAQRALEIGLVNEVVPHEKLLDRAREIAEKIKSVNQGMMLTVKSLIEFRDTTTFAGGIANERSEFQKFINTHMKRS